MILFLDTVSPTPEFTVIKNNKFIQSIQILNKKSNKISENIFPAFLKIQKKLKLETKLKKLIVCTGPGSYTALRIGIAFMYGISFAKKIPLVGISCFDILKFSISKSNLNNTLIFVNSLNNQNFICINDNKKILIKKIDEKFLSNNFDFSNYEYSVSNSKLPSKVIEMLNLKNHKIIKLKKILLSNISKVKIIKKTNIIEPIYVSNNKLLG